MATITTNDDFVNACNYLIAQGQLASIGARFIDAVNRVVIDEDNNSNITPNTATLEAALDSANTEIADNLALKAAALVAVTQGKDYLRRQMLKASPNVNDVYTTVKNVVDANTYLAQMVNNVVAINSNAYAWTLNLVTPTALDKQRYIKCVMEVVALLT